MENSDIQKDTKVIRELATSVSQIKKNKIK